MIDLAHDEVLLAAVRGPGADREPDEAARARAAELDADAYPDLRGDRDRGGGPTLDGPTLDGPALGPTPPHPGPAR